MENKRENIIKHVQELLKKRESFKGEYQFKNPYFIPKPLKYLIRAINNL